MWKIKFILQEFILKLLLMIGAFILYFIINFFFKGCGIDEVLNQRFFDALPFTFYLTLMILFGCQSILRWKNKNRLMLALSISISLLPLYFVVISNKDFLDRHNYYEAFDSKKWSQSKTNKMARTIIEQDLFRGKNHKEVINVLGNDKNVYVYERQIEYLLEGGNALIICFENGVVSTYDFACID